MVLVLKELDQLRILGSRVFRLLLYYYNGLFLQSITLIGKGYVNLELFEGLFFPHVNASSDRSVLRDGPFLLLLVFYLNGPLMRLLSIVLTLV